MQRRLDVAKVGCVEPVGCREQRYGDRLKGGQVVCDTEGASREGNLVSSQTRTPWSAGLVGQCWLLLLLMVLTVLTHLLFEHHAVGVVIQEPSCSSKVSLLDAFDLSAIPRCHAALACPLSTPSSPRLGNAGIGCAATVLLYHGAAWKAVARASAGFSLRLPEGCGGRSLPPSLGSSLLDRSAARLVSFV